jgi:Family of unknown function (DUF6220)
LGLPSRRARTHCERSRSLDLAPDRWFIRALDLPRPEGPGLHSAEEGSIRLRVAGVRGGSYQVWRVLIALIAAACVVQIFLAGRGAFGIHGAAKLDNQKSFDPHRALGEIIGLLAVLAFLAALLAWRNKRLIWLTFALAFMAEILQHLFALPKHPWVAGLHALDGIAILGLAAVLAHRAWRLGDAGASPTPRNA